jgi:hypothetical protein
VPEPAELIHLETDEEAEALARRILDPTRTEPLVCLT